MKKTKTSTAHRSTSAHKADSPFFKERSSDGFFSPSIQGKLKLSNPDDPLEKEADQVAEQVVHRTAKNSGEVSKTSGQFVENQHVPKKSNSVFRKRETDDHTALESSNIEDALAKSRGGGSPLSNELQGSMGQNFGRDLSSVRIHTDSNAENMSEALNAKAFAHGQDIYFNKGKYNPSTREGENLLAHELTHTIQQKEGKILPQLLYRQTTTRQEKPNEFKSKKRLGQINRTGSNYVLTIPSLKVPKVKKPPIPSTLEFELKKRPPTTQRDKWDKEMLAVGDLEKKIEAKIKKRKSPPLVKQTAGQPLTYGFKLRYAKNTYVLGTVANMKQRMIRPFWSPEGAPQLYDVDHKIEMQIGGQDTSDNYWLWAAEANRASGSKINTEKQKKIDKLVNEATGLEPEKMWKRKPNPFTSSGYRVKVNKVIPSLSVPKPGKSYSREDIKTELKPLDGLIPLTKNEIKKLGFDRADQLLLFSNPQGGRAYKIDKWDRTKNSRKINLTLGPGVTANGNINFVEGSGGTLDVEFFQGTKFLKAGKRTVPLKPIEGLPMAASIPRGGALVKSLGGFNLDLLSPIQFKDAGIEPGIGLVAKGIINPTLPFLKKDFSIDFEITGTKIALYKSFTMNEIKVPKPFNVYGGAINLSVRTAKSPIKVSGQLDFGIEGVGEGFIKGKTNGKEFGIGGEFSFDKKLFNNAKVKIGYDSVEGFTVSGEIQIPKGKVKGIKKASANVSYKAGTLEAKGDADLSVKGLESGSMNLKYSKDLLSIGGKFNLSKEIPRLKSGSVKVNLTRKEGQYELSGAGSAVLDIPGVDSAIGVDYKKGILIVEATVGFEKGIAKGKLKVGVTNRAVDPASQALSGEPGNKWTFYGKGDLNLKLTPWLQAGAGITLTPSGEMEVRGEIGIPSTVNVFDRKEIRKRLFNFPTLRIPIFAIPLGVRNIGLEATIGGGIDFNAGFGPGKLEQLKGTVNYKPGQEDAITLAGKGKFVIPADANLRIFGRAGIGLSIAIASINGSIELGGSVGIKGAAEAALDVNWSKSKGIVLDAVGRIYVEPSLKFDVGLVLEASALFWSKEWKKKLAQKEFGSGMRFGLEFPVHYEQNKPFDLSLKDIKVIRPDLSMPAIVKKLGKQLI